MSYIPQQWYWVVNASTTQVYSSAAAAYVAVSDATYTAWLAAGNQPTPIASEVLLAAVFAAQYPAGWPSAAVRAQAQTLIDASDTTMHRIAEAVALGSNTWTSSDVVAWVEYRRLLRTVVAGTSTTLPSKPSYPVGT